MRNPSHLPYLAELALSGYGTAEDFAEHYPLSAAGELGDERDDRYYGRNVIWLGTAGRMVRVNPRYMTHISGNIFDEDKLAAIVAGIQEAPERVEFYAPYGTVGYVDPGDVKESIEAALHGDDYLDKPLSTGDEDLDAWLVDPEQFVADHGISNTKMERRLKAAVAHDEGDLGQLTFSIRDGNHRAFGALIAGEPYVYMIVSDNQMQDLKDPSSRFRKMKSTKKIKAALE